MERGHTLYFPAKPEKENRIFCIFNWGKIVKSQLNRRESLGKALIKLCLLLKRLLRIPGQIMMMISMMLPSVDSECPY